MHCELSYGLSGCGNRAGHRCGIWTRSGCRAAPGNPSRVNRKTAILALLLSEWKRGGTNRALRTLGEQQCFPRFYYHIGIQLDALRPVLDSAARKTELLSGRKHV